MSEEETRTNDEGSRCGYVFDPDDWEAEHDSPSRLTSDDLNDEGRWRCPHESQSSRDYCLFHRSPNDKSASAVREALLTQIGKSGESEKQFIGARFGALDLSNSSLESAFNHPIDLRHAKFEERTTWKDAIVHQPLYLDGAIFHERANFNMVTFESELYCSGVTFHDAGWFNDTDITHGGWFYRTEFGDADFSMSTFEGKADFRDATFEHTHFRETVFEERAEFHKATFDHVMFSGAQFEDLTYFEQATVPERANFRHASFDEKVSFDELVLSESTCYVDLRDADVTDGLLVQPVDGVVLYDLKSATVGDVTLGGEESDEELLVHYRFVGTTFDGFDFGRYRDSLNATNWRLHEFDPVPGFDAESAGPPSSGALENTYLKAKNGANAIGDTNAAAEFFRKEMLYRREQYVSQMWQDRDALPRFTTGFKWGANLLLDLTSGYGERPSRTVLSSLCVIFAFTALFAVAWPTQPYDHPTGSLILSLESFVGVVLGGAEQVEDPWVRLLASIEGFMGAFFIALFVFALTRSIHR